MNFYAKGFSVFFAAVGLSLLFCFSLSPWKEKQFDDFVAISSTSVDLGQVVCFEKANGEFTLTNLTSAPIPFRLAADCSCTTIASPSGVIEPSAAHVVKFTYSPKSIAALASSIQKEGSDITVSLLAKDNKFSQLIAVRVDGVFPMIIDRFRLLASVEPLQLAEVVVPFSIAKDVKNVRLVSAPSFLTESRIDEPGDAMAFRANIEMPIGTHKGSVVLEFDVQNVKKPVRLELPIAVIVEKPYAFSSDVLALSPNNDFRLEARPKFGALQTEFIKVGSDTPLLTTKIEGHLLTISCKSKDGVSLPVTGRLKVSVRAAYSDGREVITEDDLPFIVSEGGSKGE